MKLNEENLQCTLVPSHCHYKYVYSSPSLQKKVIFPGMLGCPIDPRWHIFRTLLGVTALSAVNSGLRKKLYLRGFFVIVQN